MDITPRGFEKASDKLTAEQLNKSVDEVVVEAPTESVPEKPVETEPETPEQATPDKPVVEEEEKVPKSRFLTMHQRAVEAEKALRTFEAEKASAPKEREPIADDEGLKKYYTDTFGDTPQTEALYKAELARLTAIEDKAAERAYERFTEREKVEADLIDQRVSSFDAAFEELSIVEGKEFSDDEQVAMLDIVEEYSPKDKNGKLIGDFLLPLDKAYEIFMLNNEPKVQAKKTERNAVAGLTGARSEGAASSSTDADWRPGQGRRWWNKVP